MYKNSLRRWKEKRRKKKSVPSRQDQAPGPNLREEIHALRPMTYDTGFSKIGSDGRRECANSSGIRGRVAPWLTTGPAQTSADQRRPTQNPGRPWNARRDVIIDSSVDRHFVRLPLGSLPNRTKLSDFRLDSGNVNVRRSQIWTLVFSSTYQVSHHCICSDSGFNSSDRVVIS